METLCSWSLNNQVSTMLYCFDDKKMYGRILSQNAVDFVYSLRNSSVSYRKQGNKIYQTASVCRTETDRKTGTQTERELYVNRCEMTYKLPDGIKIEEGGTQNE